MTPTLADYLDRFNTERAHTYPVVDDLELRCGFALDRARLEDAARVLACPVKAHAPNWQHGRVLYALTRQYMAQWPGPFVFLDIGTAKGFSALCLRWALDDAGIDGTVTSVDVIDPEARVRRNTVAELNGYLTLWETLRPWPEAETIQFQCQTGATAIGDFDRIHVAYVDGKHSFEAVSTEATLLAARQHPGDLAIFDDAQIPDVKRAITKASKLYDLDWLTLLPERQYAIGVRRG